MNNKNTALKVGIIWANIDSSNLGVSALAYSTLVIFEEIARRSNLTFEYILWGDKQQTRIIKVNGKNIQINQIPNFAGGDTLRYIKNLIVRPRKLLNFKYLKELDKCDILVDTGEGDSYADIYGIERFRHFDYIKARYHNKNIPYVLLPQTIGPFDSKEAQGKAKKSLSKSSVVIARDSQSYEFCKNLAPESNLVKSIDMAFFLPYNAMQFPETDKIKLGLNISGLLWEGGYTKNNQFNLKENYKEVVIKILDRLLSSNLYEVHLVGHVNGEVVAIDEDFHILELIKKKYPQTILAPKFDSPIEAKSYISGLDCFMGARMHSCIAAISSGVPVLPMAYSRKFNGLFLDTLTYPYLIDLKEDSLEGILIKIEDFLDNRERIIPLIAKIQKDIIEVEKENLISLITNYIQQNV